MHPKTVPYPNAPPEPSSFRKEIIKRLLEPILEPGILHRPIIIILELGTRKKLRIPLDVPRHTETIQPFRLAHLATRLLVLCEEIRRRFLQRRIPDGALPGIRFGLRGCLGGGGDFVPEGAGWGGGEGCCLDQGEGMMAGWTGAKRRWVGVQSMSSSPRTLLKGVVASVAWVVKEEFVRVGEGG
ncbi:hypothetical protein HBH92_111980 [Parastagonospora nodorum]|nr:hypothetical protein HBH92_111980 [Parastagonospora nodorum]KAH4438953.1 hypothetical protein HBH93_090820 [Parastagonospora nodorum]KAH4444947.1 hypothetical protein HBH91_148480 [Parastagonospora nodorum]KAH4492853.1 hypothetical protein HBH89_166600 [Parastagonospora nodorum]KAH4546083.1 hypothetical protein HBH85_080180 [Parastagonospora nodorum]